MFGQQCPTEGPQWAISNAAALRLLEWLFLGFMVSVPLMQLGLDLPGGTATVADVLFIGVLLVGVVAIVARATRPRNDPVYVSLLGYFIVASTSTAFSDSPHRSGARLLIELYMVLLAVVSLNAVSSVQAFRRTAIAWMVGTAATTGAGLFGVALFYSGYRPSWQSVVCGGYGSLPPGTYPRVHGLFLNMNMCCDYLIISCVLLLMSRKLGWVRPPLFWLMMIGICITAAFTVSACIGGLLLAGGIWEWRQHARRSTVGRVSLAAGGIGALAFWLACFISPVNSAGKGWHPPLLNRTLQASSRLLCWGEAYKIWSNHPVIGRGTGLEVPCPAYRDASGETEHLLDAHNMYLNTLATKGVLGLVALLSIFIVALWPPRHMRISGEHEVLTIYNGLRIAVISAFLYAGLSGSFEHTRHLWVLVGLLAGARNLRVSRSGQAATGEYDIGKHSSLDGGQFLPTQ